MSTRVREARKEAARVDYEPRLKVLYERELRAKLKDELGLSSPMEVPRIEKITLNMGVGEAKTDAKQLDAAIEELTIIAGQRAQVRTRRASRSPSFKLREGMPIGASVTLRGARMYEFLDRLVSIALPRIRDFRGLNPQSFDGRGNYSLGIREQIIFPEIDYDDIQQVRGLDVAITTTAQTDEGLRAAARARPAVRGGRKGATVAHGKDITRIKAAAPAEAPVREYSAATAAGARAPSSASSASAGSACASSPHQGVIPGMTKIELVRTEMLTDPVADMLTRIRNANKALHEHAEMPTSRLKEGSRASSRRRATSRTSTSRRARAFDTLVIELKFGRNRERVITDLKRVSKPGRRVYARKDRLPRVLGGMGVAILSTSNGLITSRTAAEQGVGGEVVCFVW